MSDDRHGSHTVFPSISIKHGAPCASKAAKIEGLDYRPASSQRYVLERDARLPIDAQHAHLIESVHISGTDFINSVAFFLAVKDRARSRSSISPARYCRSRPDIGRYPSITLSHLETVG